MVQLISLFFIVSFSWSARAEVLFEGYSKIISGEKHIGYVISRYEFDAKKKRFASTYFLKTSSGGSDITESLKAYADADLAPLSYEYTSIIGKQTKTIDAKFKNGQMSAVVKNGQQISRIERKIPKGTFLSTFLVYLMLKSKEGLKSETKYEYQAIAEEEGTINKGQALVGKEETFNGFKCFKILNTYKDAKFLSYVNERGEVLGTTAMGQGIGTELVGTAAEATASFPVSATLLKTLFDSVPAGQDNVVSNAAKLKSDLNKQSPSKEIGIPQGEGLIIKAQPEKSENKGN